jgi:hypothetical protein
VSHALAFTFLLVAAPAGLAPPAGTATGRLTIGDATVALHHVYAAAQRGFFDESKEDIRVLLSDVALDDEAQGDVFARIHLARDGKARIVEVVIDASGQPISGAFYAPEFEGMISATGMHRFDDPHVEPRRIAGRLHTDGAHEFQGIQYAYDAAFEAPIPRPPTPEETAGALASPPGRVAATSVAAIVGGRLDDFRSTLDASAAARFAGEAGASRFAELRGDFPPDSRVTWLERPDATHATATIDGTRDGVEIESTFELVLNNGVWRVSRAGVEP